jgi:molybdopterin converting factor small subunit
MPCVRLKIHAWLIQDYESDSSSFKEISLSILEDESLYQFLSRLAAKNKAFRRAIFGEKTLMIREDILVVLNGRIVQPGEFFGKNLHENDEVIFLPLLSGG